MKKLLAACICTGLIFSMSGCSLGNILEQINSTGDISAENPSEETAPVEVKNPRIY